MELSAHEALARALFICRWQAFNFLQLDYFFAVRGYTFYMICLFLLVVLMFINLGLFLWLANSCKNNSINYAA